MLVGAIVHWTCMLLPERHSCQFEVSVWMVVFSSLTLYAAILFYIDCFVSEPLLEVHLVSRIMLVHFCLTVLEVHVFGNVWHFMHSVFMVLPERHSCKIITLNERFFTSRTKVTTAELFIEFCWTSKRRLCNNHTKEKCKRLSHY